MVNLGSVLQEFDKDLGNVADLSGVRGANLPMFVTGRLPDVNHTVDES